MASSSSSSSSSSNLKRYYHVFLSFRGTDVRDGFLSHLYTGLDQRGIHTFMDNEELRKGESITPALMKAIEESRIAIIVFSKDYASSPWCLEELARIMECKDQRDLKVFPVFYKVEPREVRTPRASYRKAMVKHKKKFGKDSEKVKRWKKALLDAGSLSGWEYHKGDEAKFLQSIVKELSIHLDRTLLDVAEYPVEIDFRVRELISLSRTESGNDDVVMIGLWGTGGVGKTTLAKAMYNAIERQFQGACFLARVRENTNESNGLVSLQEKLLSQVLSHRNLTVYNVDGGITLMQERLCCKKVLLVLDDVDQLVQLNALAGKGHWFGKGSRIIVTSRDKHLLKSHGINCVYEVKTLDNNEALDLFSRHAFPNSEKVEITRKLIDGALHYAKGLPLALEVLGSFLRGREEPEWESALRKLSKDPNQDINGVLKTSFDGLENNEKEIFLDIACFFKGKKIGDIKHVLDSCGFEATIGIQILMERSLITNGYWYLQMHDLVQLMGKDIVNQEHLGDPGKRSRLWAFEDIQYILCEDTGTNAVKAIVLDSLEAEEITISPHAFTNMKRLRMLILSKVHISSEGPVRLPNELRWLKWSNAPDLEFGSGPNKLVGIDVQESGIKQLGGKLTNFRNLKFVNFRGCKSLTSFPDLSSIPNLESLDLSECESLVEIHQSVGYLDKLKFLQNFRNLKFVNFRGCKSLTSFPDLSSIPNLESLDLSECESLVEIHQSVGYLDKLKFLSLELCSNLSIFPNKLKMKSLETLNLSSCSKLEKFPDILGARKHLESLYLRRTAIKELLSSIQNLVSVEEMSFVMFPKNLEGSTDPDGHLGFPNLDCLDLSDCNLSEVDFLESPSNFPKLEYLYLSENKFTHLPTSINKYHALEVLHVDKCQQLQEIPQLPPILDCLNANGCKSLLKVPDLSSHSSHFLDIDLSSCCELIREMAHVSLLEGLWKMTKVRCLLSGGEMPERFLRCNDGLTTFMVPPDLYEKYLGLALCVDSGLVDAYYDFRITVNGHLDLCNSAAVGPKESDHVLLMYWPRGDWGEHLRNDWNQFVVCVRGSNCGVHLIFEQPEDELRVVVQHHQRMETNWIPEEIDSEEDEQMVRLWDQLGTKPI